MSSPNPTLHHHLATLVSETLNDEAIVVNLLNGHYHRITGLACRLWTVLATPCPFADWRQQARVDIAAVDDAVLWSFAAALQRADLLLVTVDGVPLALDEPATPSALTFETYEDMSDLLSLDPVLGVTELGWPHAAP